MVEKRRSQLREVLRPKVARLWIGIASVAGIYQFGCDQFDWPKLPALWNMTPFPWWGWFFVALVGFVYALFEYVRRSGGTPGSPLEYDDADLRAKVAEADTRSRGAEEAVTALRETVKVNDRKARDRVPGMISESDEFKRLVLRVDPLETNYTAILRDYQNMRGLEALFEEKMGATTADLAALRAALEKFQGEHFALNSLNADTLKLQFDTVHQRLLAIFYRERMLKIAERIDGRAEWLFTRIESGNILSVAEWEQWQGEEAAWRFDITDWCGSAVYYVPDARQQIEAPDNNKYENGPWQFREEQFPTHEGQPLLRSNAVHRYKTYRIAAEKWPYVRENVNTAVHRMAFDGHWPDHWQRPQ